MSVLLVLDGYETDTRNFLNTSFLVLFLHRKQSKQYTQYHNAYTLCEHEQVGRSEGIERSDHLVASFDLEPPCDQKQSTHP